MIWWYIESVLYIIDYKISQEKKKKILTNIDFFNGFDKTLIFVNQLGKTEEMWENQ